MARNRIINGILLLFAAVSCMGVDETAPEEYVTPDAGEVSVTGLNTLIFTLTSGVDEPEKVCECGFYYGRSAELTSAGKLRASMNSGYFTENLLLKDYESSYYVCSYISNGIYEIRSDVKKIEIGPLSDYVSFESPVVDSYASSSEKAELSVVFSICKGVEVTSAGICYGETANLSLENGSYAIADKIVADYISSTIEGLVTGRQYYARAFIRDGEDIAYAPVSAFKVYAVPEVATLEVNDVTDCGAHLYGEVLDDCGKLISERGFVWTEGYSNPTMSSQRKIVSGRTGIYEAQIDGLKPNTLYTVRAYAENEEGIAYGDALQFTTDVALPAVVTERVSGVTSSSAVVYAKVISDGGETVSDYGVLLSTSVEIDPGEARKLSAVGPSSSFDVTVSGLSRKTMYYVQAYVTNSAGTAYGEILSFETMAELPVVFTLAVSGITDVAAVSGGEITDDGGDEIVARGVVWGKTSIPVVGTDTQTTDGTGAGKYTSDITGLSFETIYYVRAYAVNSAGTAYGEAVQFTSGKLDMANVMNLAEAGTANCYIISGTGIYRFPTMKGNSNESVGDVASVEVLWESFGTSVTPNVGDLVDVALFRDGQIVIGTSSKEGNSVVAAKDSSGNILWSWHIWLTDQPEEQVYYNNAGIMMDRNLGATSATPGEVGALGLLYQWGRKDPFLGSSSISSTTEAKSTITWPSTVSSNTSNGTIEYATANPTTFIGLKTSNWDWYYTGSSSTDDTRWQSEKTIYDPCPVGWRVPDGGEDGVWSKALGSSSSHTRTYDGSNKGMNFSGKFGDASAIWYPAVGDRDGFDGMLGYVGSGGRYWSVALDGYYAYSLGFSDDGFVVPLCDDGRAYGRSVRCLKISEIDGDNEGFGDSYYEW